MPVAPNRVTGAPIKLKRFADKSFRVPFIVRFILAAAVGSTIVNLGTLLGLRQGVHYQLGKLDWEFSLETDPVDGAFQVWLIQYPELPNLIVAVAAGQLAHLRQSFRIGAGTLTVAMTTVSEVLNVDVGIMAEDIDDKLMIVAHNSASSTSDVDGTLEIIETFVQRSWKPFATVEELVACA